MFVFVCVVCVFVFCCFLFVCVGIFWAVFVLFRLFRVVLVLCCFVLFCYSLLFVAFFVLCCFVCWLVCLCVYVFDCLLCVVLLWLSFRMFCCVVHLFYFVFVSSWVLLSGFVFMAPFVAPCHPINQPLPPHPMPSRLATNQIAKGEYEQRTQIFGGF